MHSEAGPLRSPGSEREIYTLPSVSHKGGAIPLSTIRSYPKGKAAILHLLIFPSSHLLIPSPPLRAAPHRSAPHRAAPFREAPRRTTPLAASPKSSLSPPRRSIDPLAVETNLSRSRESVKPFSSSSSSSGEPRLRAIVLDFASSLHGGGGEGESRDSNSAHSWNHRRRFGGRRRRRWNQTEKGAAPIFLAFSVPLVLTTIPA